MTEPADIQFKDISLDDIAEAPGLVVVFLSADGKLNQTARRVNKLTRGALDRVLDGEAFDDLGQGDSVYIGYPSGMAAEAVQVIKLDRRPTALVARKAGVGIARIRQSKPTLVLAGNNTKSVEIALGLALRSYDYSDQRSEKPDEDGPVVFMVSNASTVSAEAGDIAARAKGVFFTRDLTNAPANVLTTEDFAAQLAAMREIGLDVEVLEEADLEKLGMRTLLAVGQGSESPSKVVVMQWKGGGGEAPFALIGKGVVFDTGGISLKPGAGMEEMTMDMGGAGVVSGVMRTIALRKAKANVVGIVGLVENMPDGKAQRPGDVVTSMKGDTVEVINTDAEGRLVLADVLWYAQERFNPSGMIDLATLTGAIIIALGHENAGVFANDDALCDAFLIAAKTEGEGAWRMPLEPAYDKLIKSRIADMKNIGGRPAGSVTAAQFLQRFVRDDVPWIHLDIAGVASVSGESRYAPKGATGWGVLALDRLIRDRYEN